MPDSAEDSYELNEVAMALFSHDKKQKESKESWSSIGPEGRGYWRDLAGAAINQYQKIRERKTRPAR
jgi:hypothetical protein